MLMKPLRYNSYCHDRKFVAVFMVVRILKLPVISLRSLHKNLLKYKNEMLAAL